MHSCTDCAQFFILSLAKDEIARAMPGKTPTASNDLHRSACFARLGKKPVKRRKMSPT